MAPITLVLGQNSAGKSSILHALTLLKQTHASREGRAALLPRADDGIVDLGSFKELLFDHDSSRTLQLGAEVSGAFDSFGPTRPLVRELGLDRFLINLSFRREPDDIETRFAGYELYGGHMRQMLARFEMLPGDADYETRTRLMERAILRSSPRSRHSPRGFPFAFSYRSALCTAVTDWPELWALIHKLWSQRRKQISESLGIAATRDRDPLAGPWAHTRSERPPFSSVREARRFYSSPFTADELRIRLKQWCAATEVLVDGFVPRSSSLSDMHLLPELVAMNPLVQMGWLPILDVGWATETSASALEDAIVRLFPLGPWRRPPERHYIFGGTSPGDVGYNGAQFPLLVYRLPDLLKEANTWLDRLGIGHELIVVSLGGSGSELFELRLRDRRRANAVEVALTDVGFGVSQILPFIVQCLVDSRRLISIEQPEVHIHPRLQADLGELLAFCIGEPRRHQFLIETHSEHLVLRLQKLVRNGNLRPDDVSVVFVSRGSQGASARRLRLDDDGDFVDEWPGGFFPERLRELGR